MTDSAHPAILVPAVSALLAELASAPHAALVRFPSLPIATQCALLLAAPAEQRMELLLVAPECDELIRSLPAPVVAQTVTACEDEADLLLAHASAEQIATAIDLDCRRRGVLQPARFRRWIGLLVAASRREVAAALRGLDLDLLAAGLATLVRMDARASERVRIAEAFAGTPSIRLDDFDSDDEAVMAFLRLLDEDAPERLAALGAALCARDQEELGNEDHAAYEERMAEAGLRDWAQAAETLADGVGSVARAPLADGDEPGARGVSAHGAERRFLDDALAALIAREDCDHRRLDRLATDLARLVNDAIVASDGGADEAQARAARAHVDGLLARGLARLSASTPATAAGLLVARPLAEIVRAGRAAGADGASGQPWRADAWLPSARLRRAGPGPACPAPPRWGSA